MKFKLSKDTCGDIVKTVDTIKNDKNKIRFLIGIRNMGKGVACKSVIVNGGIQVEVGFTTVGVPKDFEDGKPLAFAVRAADFSRYISRLLAFDSDMEFSTSEIDLKIKVGTLGNISIPLVSSDECEPLLPNSDGGAFVHLKATKENFNLPLHMGGYLVCNDADNASLRDRVVLSFENRMMKVLSTDGCNIAEGWAELAPEYNNHKMVLATSALSEEEQLSFVEKMKEIGAMQVNESTFNSFSEEQKAEYMKKVKDNKMFIEKLMEKAKANGFIPDSHKATLSANAFKTLCRLIGNAQNVEVLVSARYLKISTGNVCVTLSLSGAASKQYDIVLKAFAIDTYPARCVIDRDQLVNALSVLAIDLRNADSDASSKVAKYCEFTFKDDKLVIEDSAGNKMRILSSASNGDFKGISLVLMCDKLIRALSRMPAGNVVLLMDTNIQKALAICNGDIEGVGLSAISYVAQVNPKIYQSAKEDANDSTNKESKKKENSTDRMDESDDSAEDKSVDNEVGSTETTDSSGEDISKMAAEGNIDIEEESVV